MFFRNKPKKNSGSVPAKLSKGHWNYHNRCESSFIKLSHDKLAKKEVKYKPNEANMTQKIRFGEFPPKNMRKPSPAKKKKKKKHADEYNK